MTIKKLFLLSLLILSFFYGAHGQKAITICELFEMPLSEEEVYTISAVLVVPDDPIPHGSPILYSPSCNNRDHFATIDLSTASRWQRRKLRRFSFAQSYNVTLSGRASIGLTGRYGYLSPFRGEIGVLQILSVKPVKADIPLPDLKADAPILETTDSLRNQNSILMFSILNGRDLYPLPPDSFDGSRFILNGNPVEAGELRKIFEAVKDGSFGVQITDAEAIEKKWILKGTFTHISESGRRKTIHFKNEYARDSPFAMKLSQMDLTKQN